MTVFLGICAVVALFAATCEMLGDKPDAPRAAGMWLFAALFALLFFISLGMKQDETDYEPNPRYNRENMRGGYYDEPIIPIH